jgi:hypothetical protein
VITPSQGLSLFSIINNEKRNVCLKMLQIMTIFVELSLLPDFFLKYLIKRGIIFYYKYFVDSI